MPNQRPDLEASVARARDESCASRGKLRTFFDYGAGVRKIYAMLGAAQADRTLEVDIVVACVEPAGRPGSEYIKAAAVVMICGFLGWVAGSAGLADSNVVMIFLAGVTF